MDHDITVMLKEEHKSAKVYMINAVISDPFISRYYFEKRPYLLTDFSKFGVGYDLCQPNDDPDSMVAMRREMEGGDCEFLYHKYKLLLQSTGFGSCRTRGRETNLNSHLGEGFALDWEIHKNHSKLWGVRFTSITDSYGLRFILTYKVPNPVVLRMKMRLMLWAMDLYHRGATYMVSPDYFSRIGVDIFFDKMTRLYLNKTINIRKLYPPMSGSMRPENTPRPPAPRMHSKLTTETTTISANLELGEPVNQFIAPLFTSVMINESGGHKFCLQTVPIITGFLTEKEQPKLCHVPLYIWVRGHFLFILRIFI